MATESPNPPTSDPVRGAVVEVVDVKREASPEEKAQLRRWLDTIEREKNLHDELWKQIRANRAAAAGKSNYDVHINLHQASLETLLPILYAQDPEIQVKPARSVNQERYAAVKAFSSTLEIVTQRQLAGDDGLQLQTMCERAIRAFKTAGFGVVKVGFQTDTEQDPLIVRRINDVQDNLKRVASLTEDLAEDCQSPEGIEATRKDLQDTLVALQEKVEVLKSIGVVLDLVSADDLIVPHDVSELIDYRMAPWIAERAWMSKDSAKEKYDLSDEECGMLVTYPDRNPAAQGDPDKAGTKADVGIKHAERVELVVVWEIWDKRNNMVYTVLEGLTSRYARPAFPPRFTGRRFYPYFLLASAWVDGKREPLSAVEMADPLVQEYNATRSGYREHRKEAIPATIIDAGVLSKPDADKIKNRERIEQIAVDAGGNPVANVVHVLEYPRVDPGLYDTTIIRGELDVVYGVQDAMRGVVMKPKTLGEAEIMQQGLATRTGGQRGALESWLTEIANYTAEVLLLAMPREQALQIAGDGGQWPELTRAQIQSDVVIQIRAGSTGKPDKQKDIQTWQEIAEALLNMLDKYVAALATGQQGVADSYKAIFSETLKRLDDRLDPEQFLPKVEPQPPPQPPPQPLSDSALQGKQIEAMQGIVGTVQSGVLDPTLGEALIKACFPHVPQELVSELIGGQVAPAAMGPPGPPGPPVAPGADANPADGGLPPPAVLKSVLDLAKANPEVGNAIHAAVERMRAGNGGTPPPPG